MALNSNALVTLTTFKSHLGVPVSDSSQDTRLELFINAASTRIEKYCDRLLKNGGALTEYYSGRKSNILMTNQFPIISISSLHIDSARVFDSNTLIDSSNYFIDDSQNTILYNTYFPQGFRNIKLVYQAGFNTVPSDLELACLWVAEWYYMHRQRGDMGRSSISKGDESQSIISEMPMMIKEILNDYKRTEFANSSLPIGNL